MSSALAIDADVAALLARLGTELRRITSDSRDVREGDAFAASPGMRHDGRAFIADAIARGAGAVLWETTASIGIMPGRFLTCLSKTSRRSLGRSQILFTDIPRVNCG